MLFLLLAVKTLTMTAQEQEKPQYQKNYLGISVTELAFVDIRLSYERRINDSHGLRFEMGYKPAFRDFTDATIINFGQKPTAWCYRNTARWYYFSVGYRYYFNRSKTIYLYPEVFYKDLEANEIVYTWGLENSTQITNQYELRSMTTNMFGGNLLIGKKFNLLIHKITSIGIDIFAGFSFRSKAIKTTTYGSTKVSHYHDSPPRNVIIPLRDEPEITNDNLFQASLKFGIILFCAF